MSFTKSSRRVQPRPIFGAISDAVRAGNGQPSAIRPKIISDYVGHLLEPQSSGWLAARSVKRTGKVRFARPSAHRAGTDAKIAAILCHTARSAGGESADDDPSRQIPAFPCSGNRIPCSAPCYAAKFSLFRLQGIARNSLAYKAKSGRVQGGKRKFPASREYHGPRPPSSRNL